MVLKIFDFLLPGVRAFQDPGLSVVTDIQDIGTTLESLKQTLSDQVRHFIILSGCLLVVILYVDNLHFSTRSE